MLGKLLKYDLKIQLRLLGVAYLVVGMVAGVSAIVELICRNYKDSKGILPMINALTSGMAILMIVVMLAGTFIYAVLFFRKNLFKDEGYLMHTLPVKPWQLYMSKWISSTLCCMVSIVAALAAYSLSKLKILDISAFLEESLALGMPGWFIPVTLLILVLTIPFTLTQFYVSLGFGYTIQTNTTTPVNRDLLSVVSYVVLYMIQQVGGVILIFIWCLVNANKIFNNGEIQVILEVGTVESVQEIFRMVGGIYGISIGLTLVLSVVLSALTIWRMGKHLNMN